MADKNTEQQFRDFIESEIDNYTDHGTLHIDTFYDENGISPKYADELVKSYLDLSSEDRAALSFERFVAAECLCQFDYFNEIANYKETELLDKIGNDIKKNHPEFLEYYNELMDNDEGIVILMSGNNYDGFVCDVPKWFDSDYHINLMIATEAERDDDLGCIPALFPDKDDKVATDVYVFTKNADNALTYLVNQQGYSLADIYDAQFTDISINPFIDSVNDELENYTYSQGNLTALTSAKGQDFIDLINHISSGKGNIALSEQTVIGLYDGFNGATSNFNIELEKKLIVPASMINQIQIESVDSPQKEHQWTVNQICGYDKSTWEQSTVWLTNEKPVLIDEDMSDTFDLLKCYLHAETTIPVRSLQDDLRNYELYTLLDAEPISETATLTVLYEKPDDKVIFHIEYESDGKEYYASTAFSKEEFMNMRQHNFKNAIGEIIAYNSVEREQEELPTTNAKLKKDGVGRD